MSARASIGALRRRVTLEAPVDTYDDLGGFKRDFAPLTQLWARIETQSDGQNFAEQRLEQLLRHAVTIRWRSDVSSGMRFDLRGRKLVIKGVTELDERRRLLLCQCEEIA
jgi:SPP1 family predicted phage head-tail adaptor